MERCPAVSVSTDGPSLYRLPGHALPLSVNFVSKQPAMAKHTDDLKGLTIWSVLAKDMELVQRDRKRLNAGSHLTGPASCIECSGSSSSSSSTLHARRQPTLGRRAK